MTTADDLDHAIEQYHLVAAAPLATYVLPGWPKASKSAPRSFIQRGAEEG
jgi:hypothetical protein